MQHLPNCQWEEKSQVLDDHNQDIQQQSLSDCETAKHDGEQIIFADLSSLFISKQVDRHLNMKKV